MRYTLEELPGYLKAEMVERETAAETAEFVNAIVDAVRGKGISRVLISTRESRPVFKARSGSFPKRSTR